MASMQRANVMTARGALRTLVALRQPRAFLIGAVGAALMAVITSQNFLGWVGLTTGAATVDRPEPDALTSAAELAAWLAIGVVAGFVGGGRGSLPALLLGALAGSAAGFSRDPSADLFWSDLIITALGSLFFLSPGYLLGRWLDVRRETHAPDGSGRRPVPPPLWAERPGPEPDARSERHPSR